jgi:N-hydroxyarylamine O-acetyltransferase
VLEHPFCPDAYLERIRYDGPLAPSAETLCRLHRAQVMSIPFENLDLFLGRRLQIDPASLVNKLVHRRRGGYCHELNGLFGLVLRSLGFTVTPLAARVFAEETLMQKSHQLLLVELRGEHWLADTGFGSNGLIEAIPLELERVFPQHLETFRLQADPKLGFVLQHHLGDSWRNLYAFSLETYYPADYQMMHFYTSTSPASLFTQHVVCTLPTEETRLILYDAEFKVRSRDETSVTCLDEDSDSYRETLQRSFGIDLPPGGRLHSPFSLFDMML